MKTTSLTLSIFIASMFIFSSLNANDEPVATMKSSSQVNYLKTSKEGMFYGRLRSNTFYYHWDKEDTSHDTHLFSSVGGSLVYKSASFNGFDFGAGLYYSYVPFDTKDDDIKGYKAGKDVFSRHNYVNTGSKNMAVLGQFYMGYTPTKKSKVIIGRQLVDSFYTKSNDTKMVPNTFDGVILNSKDLDSTYIKLGYLARQKLRDHIENHSILMYGDSNSSTTNQPQWSENDDSAMHKGLTYTALKAKGKPTDASLIVGDFKNKSIKNLKIDISFYSVPELISQIMTELNYKIKLDNLSIIAGVRYIKQFDNGAGMVGGASLKGNVTTNDAKGYKDPNSLNSQMIAGKIVAKLSNYKLNLGYTNILDEADLVTPWRGFPTAGYTRSMARYNWRANTKSYRVELVRNTSSVGFYEDVYIQASVMFQDDDEKKYAGVNTDYLYYYIGFMQNLDFLDNAQWRYRLGYQDFVDNQASNINNIDTRLELNYFF